MRDTAILVRKVGKVYLTALPDGSSRVRNNQDHQQGTDFATKGRPRAARGTTRGDTLVYEAVGDAVTIKRLEPFDAAFHAALAETLDEWDSPEDDAAFSDL